MGVNIGIDLGTTYSVVALTKENGTTEIIQVTDNMATTASAVYIDEDGDIAIGEEAKAIQRKKGQVATFYKRTIGRDAKDYGLEDGNFYSAVSLSTIFLKELIKNVERKLGEKVDGAVITVPAYFTEHEKANTRRAAQDANINVLRMINEPTAAAIAYGLDKVEDQNVMIYDLGGGTFDISIAHISGDKIEIIATIGDFQLGGKDWDEILCHTIAEKFSDENGLDFSQDKEQMDSLMVDVEKLKRKLSESSAGDIRVKYGGEASTIRVTESEFKTETRGLLEQTGSLINKLFMENNLSWRDIDDVILVGGSSRMKMVGDYIEELSGKHPRRGINPDEAVAIGASLVAKSISEQRKRYSIGSDSKPRYEITLEGGKTVIDVISHSMGLIAAKETRRGKDIYREYYNEVMIPKNTTLEKASITKRFILNSDTMDIYLTQCESQTLPDNDQIIGKYQVFGIVPQREFLVTYFHTPDTTVGISAEQDGKKLTVSKVSDSADRSFEPELINKPEGLIVVAVDLSGSMSVLEDSDGVNKLIEKMDNGTQTDEEADQIMQIKEYIDLLKIYEKTDGWTDYRKMEKAASKVWFTAIGMTKKYIEDFIDKLDLDHISFALLGFADENVFFCHPTKSRREILRSISLLEISDKTGEGNKCQPMDVILEEILKYKRSNNIDFAYTVVLTDGYWNDSAESMALACKSKYKREQVEIVACGFGSAKEEFIRKLATKQDLSGVGDISSIGDSLSNIASVVS